MYFGVHTPVCDGSKCAPRYIRCPDNLLHSVSVKLRQEMEATTTDELNDGQDLNLDTTVLSPHPPRHARRSPDADDCGEKRQMVGGKRPMMGGKRPMVGGKRPVVGGKQPRYWLASSNTSSSSSGDESEST